jgi:hypothetical protein
MFYERGTCRGLDPRSAAHRSPRKGVGFHHARRPLWTGPLSSEVVLHMPRDAATRPKSSKHSDASITRPEPATTCATGSRGILPRHLPSVVNWPTCWPRVGALMSRPNTDGPHEGGRRPEITDAAAATAGLDAASVKGARPRHRYPRADASLYEPVNGRGRGWLSIRCPHCRGVHLGRLRPGTEPGGPRRTPCGMVWVVVRRTYRPRTEASSGAAA